VDWSNGRENKKGDGGLDLRPLHFLPLPTTRNLFSVFFFKEKRLQIFSVGKRKGKIGGNSRAWSSRLETLSFFLSSLCSVSL
jgi:hypothetical protein